MLSLSVHFMKCLSCSTCWQKTYWQNPLWNPSRATYRPENVYTLAADWCPYRSANAPTAAQQRTLWTSQRKPFAFPPFSAALGFCGDGPASSQILNGTYDVSLLDSNVALLVQHLKQTSAMADIKTHPTITSDEYVSKLKIWSESTSTSPSDLPLEHNKALITRHKYSEIDTAEDQELLAKQNKWNHGMQAKLPDLHVC